MAFERSDALEIMAHRRFVPFHYERETQLFHFSDEKKRLGEIPIRGVLHRSGANLVGSDSEHLLSTIAFASSFNRLHSLPLADVFFKEQWSESLQDETSEVMHEAFMAAQEYHGVDERMTKAEPDRREFSVLHYGQEEDPSGHAGVFLQTYGICACTKPERTPDTTYYPVPMMSYIEHNVSRPAERASLFAGLGHIARRANEYVR